MLEEETGELSSYSLFHAAEGILNERDLDPIDTAVALIRTSDHPPNKEVMSVILEDFRFSKDWEEAFTRICEGIITSELKTRPDLVKEERRRLEKWDYS